jgi:hypothetical protein
MGTSQESNQKAKRKDAPVARHVGIARACRLVYQGERRCALVTSKWKKSREPNDKKGIDP